MRILIWGKSFPRMGGVERFVVNLARSLAARGDEVLVLADGNSSSKNTEPYPVKYHAMSEILMSRDPLQILPLSKALRKDVAEFAPDVIHFQNGGNDHFLFLQVIRQLRLPYVATLHGEFTDLLRMPTATELLEGAGSITAVSYHSAQTCIDPFAPQVILNAIPNPGPVCPAPRQRRILALGRLGAEKGFDALIAAMPAVLEQMPDARLTLAGRGTEEDNLASQINALGLKSHIELRGWFHPDEVHEAMLAADLLVMPSQWQEPFGLVALEAAWAGRPCIASDVGGLPEVVADGETGVLIPPKDPASLAQAITGVLGDDERAAAMGIAARERAEQEFSFAAMINAYRDCYLDAIDQASLP